MKSWNWVQEYTKIKWPSKYIELHKEWYVQPGHGWLVPRRPLTDSLLTIVVLNSILYTFFPFLCGHDVDIYVDSRIFRIKVKYIYQNDLIGRERTIAGKRQAWYQSVDYRCGAGHCHRCPPPPWVWPLRCSTSEIPLIIHLYVHSPRTRSRPGRRYL